ncbi:MAG: hypothetical protein ACRD3C_14210, partial [Vicinamibacterales bacterium]
MSFESSDVRGVHGRGRQSGPSHRFQIWHRVALALVLVATAAATLRAQGNSNSSSSSKAQVATARVDALLADWLGRGDDNGTLRVIVNMKPGAKRGLIRALQAQGATISQDYTIIEAFAADL